MKIISQKLNIALSYQSTSDGNMWGWELKNGTWTGLMGDLQRRKADIGVANVFSMQTYFSAVDVSTQYKIEYFSFITTLTGELSQWNALALPFDENLWALSVGCIVFGMCFTVFIAKIQAILKIKESSWFSKPSNNILTLFSCVVSSVWMHFPKSTHMRILMVIWSLGFFIVGFSYKGSLVSHLTIPLREPPIDTHKQLYEKSIAVGTIGPAFKENMKESADLWVRKLSERYETVYTTDEAMSKTATGII